jgi:hypothetical protein
MCNPYLELFGQGWFNETTVSAPSRCLTALSATSLCLAAGCMGGQSGDDGDFHGGTPGGGFPLPIPEHCALETRPVEPDEETVLGVTPEKLVTGLEQPELPFHWVEYSSTNLTASHTPGPGVSSLQLTFSLRNAPADLGKDEAITELVSLPDAGSDPCPEHAVVVPVWIDADTADGALDARVKGQLTFYSPRVADLYARFSPEELGGTFELMAPIANDSDYVWSVHAYNLFGSVWSGGSRGVLSPEFTAQSKIAIGGGSAVSPPPNTTPNAGENAIVVPDSWEAVGVWPRLEQCLPGVVVDMDDAVIGKSPRAILEALGARNEFPLAVRTNVTSNDVRTLNVELTTTLAEGLVCANPTPQTGTLDVTVDAHLRGTDADTAGTLDTDLRLTVRGFVDTKDPDATLTKVHFERAIEDLVSAVERATFETSTGVSLTGTPEEYTQVWWTWFGDVATTDAPSQTSASFIVTSPNARQTAEAESQIAEGGPGFGFTIDENGQQLPGDKLLEATLEGEP